MQQRSIWCLVASLTLATAPFVSGCGDDKKGSAGPTPSADVPEEIAIEQAEGAVELANSIISSVGELASLSSAEDFSGLGAGFLFFKRAAEPVESATYTDGLWTYLYSDAASEGEFSYEFDLTATLQFLDESSQPQQFSDESTSSMSYGVGADLGFATSFEDPDTGAMSSFSSSVVYGADLNVSGFLEEDLEVAGTGDQQFSLVGSSPDGNFNYAFAMGWLIDVLVPQSGACPTGTVTMSFGQWSVLVTYNGTSTAGWTLRENGTVVASGSEGLFCGMPVGTTD